MKEIEVRLKPGQLKAQARIINRPLTKTSQDNKANLNNSHTENHPLKAKDTAKELLTTGFKHQAMFMEHPPQKKKSLPKGLNMEETKEH